MTDINSLDKATQTAKESLTCAADNYSAYFERILRVIGIIEEDIREKRSRIEEIQTRHEQLVIEYRQLGKSLESETSDLAQKFIGAINDLGTDATIAALLLDIPATTETSDLATELPGPAPIPDCDQQVRRSPDDELDEPGSLRPALTRILKKASKGGGRLNS